MTHSQGGMRLQAQVCSAPMPQIIVRAHRTAPFVAQFSRREDLLRHLEAGAAVPPPLSPNYHSHPYPPHFPHSHHPGGPLAVLEIPYGTLSEAGDLSSAGYSRGLSTEAFEALPRVRFEAPRHGATLHTPRRPPYPSTPPWLDLCGAHPSEHPSGALQRRG